jgi:hypothetical protein
MSGLLGDSRSPYGKLQVMLEKFREDPTHFLPPADFSSRGLDCFAEFGSPIVARDVSASRVDDVRKWIANVGGVAEPRAVFMDTTTVAAVEALLLDGDKNLLRSETLLDLSNFVSAFVLHDQVFHIKTPYLDSVQLNEALGGEPVIVELPIDLLDVDGPSGLLTAFWNMACDIIYEMNCSERSEPGELENSSDAAKVEEIDYIEWAWGQIVGAAPGELNISTRSRLTTIPRAPLLIRKLVASDLGHSVVSDHILSIVSAHPTYREDAMSSLSKLASECQHRYLFNQFFSNAIHLPYVPNSYRAPFQSWLMERGGVVLNHLAIAEHIDKEYRNLIAERLKIGPTNLSLPFFLTAVLSRISKIGDFGTALADLRLRARPLRQRLAELDDAILQRPKLLRLKGYVTPLKERSLH